METLASFLKQRARINFTRLQKQLDGLESAEAFEGRMDNWPDHPFGVGQDGSIAGIVVHLAAWKQMTLPLFTKEGRSIQREEFDIDFECDPNDWDSILKWLYCVGEEWLKRLDALPDQAFSEERPWGETVIPFTEYAAEMMEHDVQHSSQIEYLKVLRRARNS